MARREGTDTRPVRLDLSDIALLEIIYRQMRTALLEIRSATPTLTSRPAEIPLTYSITQIGNLLSQVGLPVDFTADIANTIPCPGCDIPDAQVDALCRHCRRLPSQHFEQLVLASGVHCVEA